MYLVYSGLFDKIRKKYFRKILRVCNIKQGMRILDYGCGPGDLLLIAKEIGIDAHGVDSFSRSVGIAKSRGLNVTQGDAKMLEYPENYFDAIVLQSVIEHINNPLEELTLLSPLLKPDGFLVVSAPTPGSNFWDDPTHIRPYTPASLKLLGEILGMKVVSVSYVFSFLLGMKLSNSIIYKLMNILPVALGSNLIAIYRK